MTERKPEQFVEQAKQVLDESVEDLDELTLARLKAARLSAVAAATNARVRPWMWSVVLPTGATAALASAVLIVSMWSAHEVPTMVALEDLDVIASGQDLEMYENLDFYYWLSEQEDAG